ncbi:hypothetical protein BST27_15575 [Mycobacterium intermedium]|uniref:DUF4333 domain-containing protein n=1 Tax=Mycobacterium intermedium TaxID=28445 RepID=A0A1E3S889_MYCIE|nr:DUF4333 domain-containing protein [Mycobacterium intermedium]MCV6964195.1 DUF4333 domain-containing protein [Mycobacterium intermedium]ODQ98304.1 hypothetical protein BHQ20_22665 [Mycobacterium intermedium]OPE47715.1 hypothetical protein BV508_20935 [Mycobacterium intermedium]ORB03373.1 hypothetical protein BST27_15575 [Mycobacterium intermedium]
MAHSIVRTLLVSVAAATLVANAGACSVSTSKSVSQAEVSDQIAEKLTDPEGNKPEEVSCPGDLEAKVGAQLNCKMKVKGVTYDVNVTVTSVEGKDVKFDMVKTRDKDEVAQAISDQLLEQVGQRPDSVTCPENLKGLEGATIRCQLVDGSKKYGITVTVTNPQDISFRYKVDDHPEE